MRSASWIAVLVVAAGCADSVVVGAIPVPPPYVPSWQLSAYMKPRAHEVGAEFGNGVAWLGDRLVVSATGSSDCGLDPSPSGVVSLACEIEGALSIVDYPADVSTTYTMVVSGSPEKNSAFGRGLVTSDDWLFVGSHRHTGTSTSGTEASTGLIEAYRRTADGLEPVPVPIVHPRPRRHAQLSYALATDGPWLVTVERFRNCQIEDFACPSNAQVTFFRREGDTWVHDVSITPRAIAVPYGLLAERPRVASIAIEGERVAVGLPHDDPCDLDGEDTCSGAGTVRIFEREGEAWHETQRIDSPRAIEDGFFGASLDLVGGTLFVGAPGEGSVWILDATTGDALDAVQSPDEGALFGYALDAHPDRVVVGAPSEGNCEQGIDPVDWDDSCERDGFGTGAAFVFDRLDTGWERVLYVKPPTERARTEFGRAVALRGDGIAVGAPGDANLGVGVGTPGLEGAPNVGAVFVYEKR